MNLIIALSVLYLTITPLFVSSAQDCCASASGIKKCPACKKPGYEKTCNRGDRKVCQGKCGCFKTRECLGGEDCDTSKCGKLGKGVACSTDTSKCVCTEDTKCGDAEAEVTCHAGNFEKRKCKIGDIGVCNLTRSHTARTGSCFCTEDQTGKPCTQKICQEILNRDVEDCVNRDIGPTQACADKANKCYDRCVDKNDCYFSVSFGRFRNQSPC